MPNHPVLMHTALDATDCRGLAEFYRQLLGLHYRPGDEPPESGPDEADWLVLMDDDDHRVLAFNQVSELARPTWPTDEVPKQMHHDYLVADVDELRRQRRYAEELGATLLFDRTDEEDEPLYVLADPAGHPFCLLVQ
ncbi:glyoxalase [Microlunatus endophyticus]|uniref:Glyoxalase n=1 Tax=Microlunatus endophyticus TaxID=1716077 RepID=A0A917W3N3_9ACTN|nr:VOC family protein [Microlunatus endophyticus]GGL60030.1 glyoxalase [Microlunatus endophyticus]